MIISRSSYLVPSGTGTVVEVRDIGKGTLARLCPKVRNKGYGMIIASPPQRGDGTNPTDQDALHLLNPFVPLFPGAYGRTSRRCWQEIFRSSRQADG